MAMASPNLFLAFGAGVLSFVSPCVLPIYPSFLSYVTGVSVDQLSEGSRAVRARVLKHSLAFFAGFSVIYIALGLTASALGSFFYSSRSWLPIVGGIFIIVMGLQLLGILRLPFLMRDTRRQLASRPEGYLGSALVGLTFAAGWTPCIGPILGAVLALAATSPGYGGLLLLAYSVGFALPFIGMAYALGSVRRLARYSLLIERVGGAVMVVMGLLLATGGLERMSAWLLEVTGFTGF